ncbi:MAG TPA: hypothetical protein VHC69_15905 [Polyangiaceae bacterium]|nr:hypothetical protein [Polyangiaceae bacterium]
MTTPSDPAGNDSQRLVVTPDDNVLAFFNAAYSAKVNNNQTTTFPLYMLKLKKADGTVVPWN